MSVVVQVMAYGGTPEEAEAAIRSANTHYETPIFVYAAATLDDLPHPMQIREIVEHFGDGDGDGVLWNDERQQQMSAELRRT